MLKTYLKLYLFDRYSQFKPISELIERRSLRYLKEILLGVIINREVFEDRDRSDKDLIRFYKNNRDPEKSCYNVIVNTKR